MDYRHVAGYPVYSHISRRDADIPLLEKGIRIHREQLPFIAKDHYRYREPPPAPEAIIVNGQTFYPPNEQKAMTANEKRFLGREVVLGKGELDVSRIGPRPQQGRYTFSGQGRYRKKKIEGLGGWWKGPGFKAYRAKIKKSYGLPNRVPKGRGYSRRRRVSKRRVYHRDPLVHQKRQLAFMKRRGFTKDEKNAMSLGASLARASEHNRSYAEKTFKKRARFASSSYDPEGTLLDSLLGANDQPEYKDTNSSSSSMMSKLSIGQL